MLYSKSIIDEEVTFPANEQLISTTDLRGKITYANASFCKVAGYTQEELLGKPHSIVRHPDMPKAAFADLWQKLKHHQPWMGLVKNRTKCGRYYWVNAFVTPIYENGEVIGFQSVRTKPEFKHVQIAREIYRQTYSPLKNILNIGMNAMMSPMTAVLGLGAELALCIFNPVLAGFPVLLALPYMAKCFATQRKLQLLGEIARKQFNSPLIASTYSRWGENMADIYLSLQFLNSQSTTILGRVTEASNKINNSTRNISDATSAVEHGTVQQKDQIIQISTAMEEMVATVGEVGRNTTDTAELVESANDLSQQCEAALTNTSSQLNELVRDVASVSSDAVSLNEQAKNIGLILNVIRGITEQTNLLALNAAIEAARAGEHGRGFAVVADEVRSMASETQHSTTEIEETISSIQQSISQWVKAMENNTQQAQDSKESMDQTLDVIARQRSLMSEVMGRSMQISAAVEEQLQVAKDINHNVHSINDVSENNTAQSQQLSISVTGLSAVTENLTSLIQSFSK